MSIDVRAIWPEKDPQFRKHPEEGARKKVAAAATE
jgi:hypothetical protein